MDFFESTYLAEILNMIAQGLLAPTVIVIISLILLSLFFIGQVIFEFFSERLHFRQNIAEIVNTINNCGYEKVNDVVAKSKLLLYQKSALITVTKNMGLPEESLFALAQNKVNNAEKIYKKRLAWTDVISKVAPMLGLMGTLIPLGPGIVALGQGDVQQLSQSLLVAFDATVCGLVCAVVALIISKIRSGWYAEYINTLESIMSCVLEKAVKARNSGTRLPVNYTSNPIKELTSRAHKDYVATNQEILPEKVNKDGAQF